MGNTMNSTYRYHCELTWLDDRGRMFAERNNEIVNVQDGRSWANRRATNLQRDGLHRVVGTVIATEIRPDDTGTVRPVAAPTTAYSTESDDWAEYHQRVQNDPDSHRVFTLNRADTQ